MALPQPPVSVADVKKRLVGLDLWLRAAANSDARYNNDAIQATILTAISELEHELQYKIMPVQVVNQPDGTYNHATNPTNADGTLPLVVESSGPYYLWHSQEYFNITLNYRPVIEVQRLRIMLTTTNAIYEMPSSWIRFQADSGQVNIVPVSGAQQLSGLTLAFTQYQLMLAGRQHIPNVFAVDYKAGLLEGWNDATSVNYKPHLLGLHRCIAEKCALQVCRDITEVFDAGILSKTLSGEGINERREYDRFARKRDMLEESVERFSATWRAQHAPVLLGAFGLG